MGSGFRPIEGQWALVLRAPSDSHVKLGLRQSASYHMQVSDSYDRLVVTGNRVEVRRVVIIVVYHDRDALKCRPQTSYGWHQVTLPVPADNL
jgi:hypothetical protein